MLHLLSLSVRSDSTVNASPFAGIQVVAALAERRKQSGLVVKMISIITRIFFCKNRVGLIKEIISITSPDCFLLLPRT